jgi:phosphoglucosamine mutase
VAALQLLAVLKQKQLPVSEICSRFEKVPQLLRSVRFSSGKPLEHKQVIQAIADGQAMLGTSGRLVVRASGTEPVIRVMGEADDEHLVETVVSEIEKVIRQVA